MITVIVPSFLLIVCHIWLRESVLFLRAQNQHKKFVKVIKYIAKVNKKKLDSNFEEHYLKICDEEQKKQEDMLKR